MHITSKAHKAPLSQPRVLLVTNQIITLTANHVPSEHGNHLLAHLDAILAGTNHRIPTLPQI